MYVCVRVGLGNLSPGRIVQLINRVHSPLHISTQPLPFAENPIPTGIPQSSIMKEKYKIFPKDSFKKD